MINNLVAGIFISVGSLALFAALFKADWLLKSQQVQFIERLIGKNGVRIFYIIVGVVSIVAGFSFWIRTH